MWRPTQTRPHLFELTAGCHTCASNMEKNEKVHQTDMDDVQQFLTEWVSIKSSFSPAVPGSLLVHISTTSHRRFQRRDPRSRPVYPCLFCLTRGTRFTRACSCVVELGLIERVTPTTSFPNPTQHTSLDEQVCLVPPSLTPQETPSY